MKKISLNGIAQILSEKELKNVMGGSGTPSRCNNPVCGTGEKACKSNQICVLWSDCPDGKRHCF